MVVGVSLHPRELNIPVKVSHYEGVEDADWHMQMQVSASNTFSSPIIDEDTNVAVTNWTYRDDGTDGDNGEFQAYPSGGVSTKLSEGQGIDKHVATAFYKLTAAELRAVYRGRDYYVRARQSSNDGSTWGDWLETILRIS